jgi:hypothetical protein
MGRDAARQHRRDRAEARAEHIAQTKLGEIQRLGRTHRLISHREARYAGLLAREAA